MSSAVMGIDSKRIEQPSCGGMLHEWVTTVDHKRIGIMYVVFALFLVLGGIEALIIRIQLMYPHTTSCRRRSSTGRSRCMARR